MVKLALKDAYLSVPVCLEHQPFLCFRWRDICYQFTCLTFGLSPAPRLFTKLIKPVFGALRRAGIRLVTLTILSLWVRVVSVSLTAAIDFFTSLGFLIINWEKSQLLPSQSLPFLYPYHRFLINGVSDSKRIRPIRLLRRNLTIVTYDLV